MYVSIDKNKDDKNGWGGSRTKSKQEKYLQHLERGNDSIHTDALTVVRGSTSYNNSISVAQDDNDAIIVDTSNNN